jgi:hypothetical protein
MSFLDNLENSLKNLESHDERDPQEASLRQSDRTQALAIAPWADQLKSSSYTKDLLEKSVVAGHRIRTKIYLAWIETTLRLEARGKGLELRPTPDGIVARYQNAAGEEVQQPIDLKNGDPGALLDTWLEGEKPRPSDSAPKAPEEDA